MDRLQQLIEQSPCWVIIGCDKDGDTDCYDPNTNIAVVDSVHTPALQFAILAHELQHAKCALTDCFCIKHKTNGFYREYHAFKGGLIACFDFIPALKEEIQHITKCAHEFENTGHKKACKKLMTTKLWRKALKSINNS